MLTTSRVSSTELFKAFTDLNMLIKKVALHPVIEIRRKDSKIEILLDASILYRAKINILEGDVKDTDSYTVEFKDLKDFFDLSKDNVKVTFSPSSIIFECSGISTSLLVGDFEKFNKTLYSELGEKIDSSKVKKGIDSLLSFNSISKSLKKSMNISFERGTMKVLFPTIWIETQCDRLYCTLDEVQAIILSKFIDKSNDIYLLEKDNILKFSRENFEMYFTRSIPTNSFKLEDYRKEMLFVKDVRFYDMATKVKALSKMVEKAEVRINLLENGIILECNSNSYEIVMRFGEMEPDYIIDKINVRLEYLNSILTFLGSDVKMYRRGDNACLQVKNNLLMLSTN